MSECVGVCRAADALRRITHLSGRLSSHRLIRHRQDCLVLSGGRCKLGITLTRDDWNVSVWYGDMARVFHITYAHASDIDSHPSLKGRSKPMQIESRGTFRVYLRRSLG